MKQYKILNIFQFFDNTNIKKLELQISEKTFMCTFKNLPEFNVINFYGTDISDLKNAEKKLKEVVDIINMSPAVAFLWKNEEGWPVEFVSDNVKNLFGYNKSYS